MCQRKSKGLYLGQIAFLSISRPREADAFGQKKVNFHSIRVGNKTC